MKKIGTISINVTLNILHIILYNRFDTNVCLAGKWDSNFNSSVVASLDWADFICHYDIDFDKILCMDFVTDSPVQRNIMTPDSNQNSGCSVLPMLCQDWSDCSVG